ncbi:hypothetical protein YC2023_056821 [Brassica napus]
MRLDKNIYIGVITTHLWSGGQGVLWISKGTRVRIRTAQDFHARNHLGFHILSPENDLPLFLAKNIYWSDHEIEKSLSNTYKIHLNEKKIYQIIIRKLNNE